MNMDKAALERITELEAQNEEYAVLVELQAEQIDELKSSLRAALGQLKLLRNDRRAEVA